MRVSTGRFSGLKFQDAPNQAPIPESSVAVPRPKFTVPRFDVIGGPVPGHQTLTEAPFSDVVDRVTSPGQPAIKAPSQNYGPVATAAKRVMDVILGLLLILCLSPVIAGLALLIKLTNPGPVLYVQERVGQHGRTFRMYKFRSMKVNADAELAALLHAQGTADTPFFKIDKDPRLTSIGGLLRRYSLDELPQLINVVLGNMSLVGPRPQRPGEVALYDEYARRRLLVPPGMTGLWQVSGRSNLSWKESLHLDIHYVDNWSLLADWVILFRTFRAVIACNGAV